MKSGFLTSEFWTMFANSAVNLMTMLGVINTAAVPDLVKAITAIITGISMMAGAVMYIFGRSYLKANVTPTISPVSVVK